VVKNVAGYDLGKLMSGSFGSYAAIVSATFKLSPLPRASATLVATWSDVPGAADAVGRVAASQLEPMTADLWATFAGDPGSRPVVDLLLRFASTPRAVEAQVARASGIMAGASCVRETGQVEAARWRHATRGVWAGSGAVVRLSWRSARLAELLTLHDTIARDEGAAIEMAARAVVGTGLIRIATDDVDVEQRVVRRLRDAAPLTGAVTILRADLELKRKIEVWSETGSSMPTLLALKHAFDPHGILNAGRGVV